MMMIMMMKQKEGSNEPEDTQGDTKDSSAYGTDNKDNNFVGFLFLSAWRHMLYSRQGGDTHELILLDCQSSVDVFSDAKLLTTICETKRILVLFCNAGKTLITNKKGLKI